MFNVIIQSLLAFRQASYYYYPSGCGEQRQRALVEERQTGARESDGCGVVTGTGEVQGGPWEGYSEM